MFKDHVKDYLLTDMKIAPQWDNYDYVQIQKTENFQIKRLIPIRQITVMYSSGLTYESEDMRSWILNSGDSSPA